MVENGEGLGELITTIVTTTQVPCCLVDVVKLCHWAVEHLRGKSGISNDTILSQLHLINIESSNNGIITCTELVRDKMFVPNGDRYGGVPLYDMHRTGQLCVHT